MEVELEAAFLDVTIPLMGRMPNRYKVGMLSRAAGPPCSLHAAVRALGNAHCAFIGPGVSL